MRKIVIGFLVITGAASNAASYTVERVLKDETTMVALALNETNVFCTPLGYGTVQLKINVPELDHLAHFDHRVENEGFPCITGGVCSNENSPTSILHGEKLVAVPIRVILSETLTLDYETKTCTRTLSEKVKSHIKNRDFGHFRSGEPVAQPYESCLKVVNL
ncbi:MAG: hypothetical protein R3A80_12135 [Bdellovibrionota bacterium]